MCRDICEATSLPTYETNCIEDWETKLDKIVEETIHQNMTLISGIPPWMQMYFDRLIEKSGKKIGDLFPNFSVMVQGGVNFEPYKAKLYESIGRKMIALNCSLQVKVFLLSRIARQRTGLLLNTNSGYLL